MQSLFKFIERILTEVKTHQDDETTARWELVGRLTLVFDEVLYKLSRKESSKLIGDQSESYDVKRHQCVLRFDELLNHAIRVFRPATKLVMEMLGRVKPTYLPDNQKSEIQAFNVRTEDRDQFFTFYTTICHVIAMISKYLLLGKTRFSERRPALF